MQLIFLELYNRLWIQRLVFLSPRIDSLFFNPKNDGVEKRIYYIGSCRGRENWRAVRFLVSILYTKQLFFIHRAQGEGVTGFNFSSESITEVP